MFDSDFEDNVFRRRLLKEVAPGVPVSFSFYSPSVKVQVMFPAEHMPGANGRYVGNGVTIEFVPEDGAAVERVRAFGWDWEHHNAFTAGRKINTPGGGRAGCGSSSGPGSTTTPSRRCARSTTSGAASALQVCGGRWSSCAAWTS